MDFLQSNHQTTVGLANPTCGQTRSGGNLGKGRMSVEYGRSNLSLTPRKRWEKRLECRVAGRPLLGCQEVWPTTCRSECVSE